MLVRGMYGSSGSCFELQVHFEDMLKSRARLSSMNKALLVHETAKMHAIDYQVVAGRNLVLLRRFCGILGVVV